MVLRAATTVMGDPTLEVPKMSDAKNALGRQPPDFIPDVFVWQYFEVANRSLSARRWGQGSLPL